MQGMLPLAILITLILVVFGILGISDKDSPPKVAEQSLSGDTSVIPGIGGGPGDALPKDEAVEGKETPYIGRYTSVLTSGNTFVLEINSDQTATLTQNSPDRIVESGVWAASDEGILVVGLIERDGQKYPTPIYLAFVPDEEEIVLYNLTEGQSANQGLRLRKQQTVLTPQNNFQI